MDTDPNLIAGLSNSVRDQLMRIPCEECSDASCLITDPLVSVVLITYNHGLYIDQAIQSILDQVVPFPFELLICEDCSTDDTYSKAKIWQKKHADKVRLLSSPENVGVFENASRGLVRCRGHYIALCEGDDYWVGTTRMAKQIECLSMNPGVGMCAGIVNVLDARDGQAAIVKSYPEISEIHTFDFNNLCYVHTSTRMLTREMLRLVLSYYRRIRFSESAILYMISAVRKTMVLPEVVSVYRLTGKGIWTGLNQERKLLSDLGLYYECRKHLPARQKPFLLTNEFYVRFRLVLLAFRKRQLGNCLKYGLRLFAFALVHPKIVFDTGFKVLRKRIRHKKIEMKHGR